MSDLVKFLAARLEEDGREVVKDPPSGLGYANLPARMHREIEAKGKILDEFAVLEGNRERLTDAALHLQWNVLHNVVRILAAVYSDHPEYELTL